MITSLQKKLDELGIPREDYHITVHDFTSYDDYAVQTYGIFPNTRTEYKMYGIEFLNPHRYFMFFEDLRVIVAKRVRQEPVEVPDQSADIAEWIRNGFPTDEVLAKWAAHKEIMVIENMTGPEYFLYVIRSIREDAYREFGFTSLSELARACCKESGINFRWAVKTFLKAWYPQR